MKIKGSLLAGLCLLAFFAIPSPATAQTRVPVKGTSIVHIYSPDGKQITGVEDDDCVTDFIYDDAGVNVGHTVHPRGTDLSLTVRYSNDRRFGTDGMPSIQWISDHDGRDIEIRTGDGTSIAEYVYRKSGHAAQVKIGDRMTLKVSAPANNRVTQTLTTHQGKKIRETIVPSGIGFMAQRRVLDVVSKELGLGTDWESKVKFRRSASSSLTIVRDADRRVILYMVGAGQAAAGFLPDGTPLFYEIRVDHAARPNLGGGNDTQLDVSTDLSGVVPDYVVLTRSGMIGAFVNDASEGAINSIWMERDDAGNVLLRFRSTTKPEAQNNGMLIEGDGPGNFPLGDRPPTKPKAQYSRYITSSRSFTALNSTVPPDFQSSTCFEPYNNSVCSYGDYVGLNCTFNSGWLEYECGGGGFGDGYGGGGGGGGGGAAPPGNYVSGDMALRAKVDRSLEDATTKLATPNCSALLDNLTYGNNTPLRALMNARGFTSAGDYITQALRFENGFSDGACNGTNVAYTEVYKKTVWVCSKMTQYSDSMGANFLIHEMLHSLGLAENPPTSGAMASAQITDEVVQACGS